MRKSLVLCLLLAACSKESGPSSSDAALQDCLGSWKTCAKHYTVVHRKPPESRDALVAWATTADALPVYRKDPWGREPEIRQVTRYGFEVTSLGEDGYEGTDDDWIYNSEDDKIASRRKRTSPEVVR